MSLSCISVSKGTGTKPIQMDNTSKMLFKEKIALNWENSGKYSY